MFPSPPRQVLLAVLTPFFVSIMLKITVYKPDSLGALHPEVRSSNLLLNAALLIFSVFPAGFRGIHTMVCLYPAAYMRSLYARWFSVFDMFIPPA
jgi:hypothetical protein